MRTLQFGTLREVERGSVGAFAGYAKAASLPKDPPPDWDKYDDAGMHRSTPNPLALTDTIRPVKCASIGVWLLG
jgi:hypothetical protein